VHAAYLGTGILDALGVRATSEAERKAYLDPHRLRAPLALRHEASVSEALPVPLVGEADIESSMGAPPLRRRAATMGRTGPTDARVF
jgi:hypothetical protein